jgi:hypothetical protein
MSSVFYRALMTSDADILQWVDVETEIVTDWPDTIDGIVASAWNGMIGVTHTGGGGAPA